MATLLRSAISQLESTGVTLTPAAKRAIELAIDAIETDPPPYQQFPRNLTTQECQRLAIERLPHLLQFLSRTRGVNEIGAFHLMEAAPQLVGLYLYFRPA
jgi:hypothetical protein